MSLKLPVGEGGMGEEKRKVSLDSPRQQQGGRSGLRSELLPGGLGQSDGAAASISPKPWSVSLCDEHQNAGDARSDRTGKEGKWEMGEGKGSCRSYILLRALLFFSSLFLHQGDCYKSSPILLISLIFNPI